MADVCVFFKLFSMNYTKHVNMQIPPPQIFPSGKKMKCKITVQPLTIHIKCTT